MVGRKLEVRSQTAADRADRIKVEISPDRAGLADTVDMTKGRRIAADTAANTGELRIAEWNEWVERSGSCRTARVAESEAGAERMNAK